MTNQNSLDQLDRQTLFTFLSLEAVGRIRYVVRKYVFRAAIDEPHNVILANFKLQTLSHHHTALAELKEQTRPSNSPRVRAYARWRLALWHFRAGPFDPLFIRVPGLIQQSLRGAFSHEMRAHLYLLLIISTSPAIQRHRNLPRKQKHFYRLASLCSTIFARRYADFKLASMVCQLTESERIICLQDVYRHFNLPIPCKDDSASIDLPLLDRLTVKFFGPTESQSNAISGTSGRVVERLIDQSGPLISVIIATYNSENTISTAIKSILAQSWEQIQLVVVDDASTDNTIAIVREWAKHDQRITVVSQPTNQGAYVARNLALEYCQGEFITLHDADDWSHPHKLSIQIQPLLESPNLVATTSRRLRASDDLKEVKLSSRGWILGLNTSSLLIRRDVLIHRLKGWHEVRFGADTELIKRLELLYGSKSLYKISTGPLSIQRLTKQSASSLSRTGYPGYHFGSRHIYSVICNHYYRRAYQSLNSKPDRLVPPHGFLFPQCMQINRCRRRHYSVIIASEFRMKGGSTLSSIEELRIHILNNISTAIIPLYRYDLNPVLDELEMVYSHIDPQSVPVLTSGDSAECELLIIRYPPAFAYYQEFLPKIKAKNVVVVVNQPPFSDYSSHLIHRYSIPIVAANAMRWLDVEPLWAPIGPLVRQALTTYHATELEDIPLSKEDWHNVIDLSSWKLRDPNIHFSSLADRPLCIGRHSRDDTRKWPDDAAELLQAYPASLSFDVRILGGAKSPTKILGGQLPPNWSVYEFGSIHPATFLVDLDVFVYFTSPGWIESFGRVIIEAMAAGIPVVLPICYKPLFQQAAIYCQPQEVSSTVQHLCSDRALYTDQVKCARQYVESRFNWDTHLERLMHFGIKPD